MANKKYKDESKPFKWKHIVGEVILWLVSWYSKYALSYGDLKEIAVERGSELDRSIFIAGYKSMRQKSISA